jgi:hypothetical protein
MMLAWLLGTAVGPATVALPVNWAGEALAAAARRWYRRFRNKDELSRIVQAVVGETAGLSHAEFEAVRQLLEDPQTWSAVGRGTVGDLVDRIAGCLPPRNGRTRAAAHVAALVIARGLLEYAVADLDPKVFQQVLMARLERMETGQASVLDQSMLGLHADLAAGFTDVRGQLARVLDLLPPGPADRGELAVYLRVLVSWLSADPWPHDGRFKGPALTAPVIERKLRVRAQAAATDEPDLDADELAAQCTRLVLLGGPGAGKTWLARRTARHCAENALMALGAGEALDDIELPLYTTCSHLSAAGGGIRDAAVSSALDQLGDLGGSRLNGALRVFFTGRNAPTLLVIDSLDEAVGIDDRLRQADTLPWRIILTSRPSSWNSQLVIRADSSSYRAVELQPLQYPEDVEPFIHSWFSDQPDQGRQIAAQIARRPDLQQAATVPLLLAFYCIVGGSEPLPELRHVLYTRVLNRMLTGRWRASYGARCDAEACLDTLRDWAWSGAASHPVSGVGMWADDIPIKQPRLGPGEQDALDHVAVPLGLPDVDTGLTLRRFVHRSIREHLVAAHVASLPADEAADLLLPHVWYDPDWEHAAPEAVATHPQRDAVLRGLICRAAGSERLPGDLSCIDANWEFRKFLSRLAGESSQADWTPEIAAIIGAARVDLARSGRGGELSGGSLWEASDRQAHDELLARLQGRQGWIPAMEVADLIQVSATTADRQRTRAELLGLLAGQADGDFSAALAEGLAQLDPTAEERWQARQALLRLLAGRADGDIAAGLAKALRKLDPTAEERRQARQKLLGVLAGQADARVAAELSRTLAQLKPTAQERQQAIKILLRQLVGQAGATADYDLTQALAELAVTAEDRRQARGLVAGLLVGELDGGQAARLATAMSGLHPTAEEKRQTRQVLLQLLGNLTDGAVAAELSSALALLDPAADDRRQAVQVLLALMPGQSNGFVAVRMADMAAHLAALAAEREQARAALVELLASRTQGFQAAHAGSSLLSLDASADNRRRVRREMLRVLASGSVAYTVARFFITLGPTAQEFEQAREALLERLRDDTSGKTAGDLAAALAVFNPTEDDKRSARRVLVRLLASTDGMDYAWVALGLRSLELTVADLATWPSWSSPPDDRLLGLARRNSELADWLDLLPSLSALSR